MKSVVARAAGPTDWVRSHRGAGRPSGHRPAADGDHPRGPGSPPKPDQMKAKMAVRLSGHSQSNSWSVAGRSFVGRVAVPHERQRQLRRQHAVSPGGCGVLKLWQIAVLAGAAPRVRWIGSSLVGVGQRRAGRQSEEATGRRRVPRSNTRMTGRSTMSSDYKHRQTVHNLPNLRKGWGKWRGRAGKDNINRPIHYVGRLYVLGQWSFPFRRELLKRNQ